MKKTSKKEKRSWVTTIVAGVAAIVSLYLAVGAFKVELTGILVSIALGAFSVLATIIAVQGRRRTLRELVDSLIHLP